MASSIVDVKNPFRPERYPNVRDIVEAESNLRTSLADMVGQKILSEIICGELPEGTRLKSTELAEQLGVSRTPVAKALAKLTADGILTQPNNHQAVVRPGAADWLVKIHELRQLLEPEAAARACGRMEEDVLKDLWALSRDAAPTRQYEWADAAQFFDFALHLSIAQFCDNLPMQISIRKCWDYKRLSYQLADGCRSTMKKEYQEHLEILTALSEGKANAAKAAMASHLRDASLSRVADRVV